MKRMRGMWMMVLCLLMCFALVGCAAIEEEPVVEEQAVEEEVVEEPVPEPVAVPAMVSFTTQLADPFPNFTFDYPEDWSIEDASNANSGIAQVNVTSPSGAVVTLRVMGAQTDATGMLSSSSGTATEVAPCQLTASDKGDVAAVGPFVVAELDVQDASFIAPGATAPEEGDFAFYAVVPQAELSNQHPQLMTTYGEFVSEQMDGVTTLMFYSNIAGLDEEERDQVAEVLSTLRRADAASVDTAASNAADDAFIANAKESLGVPDSPNITWEIGEPFPWQGTGEYLRTVTFYENGELCAMANCDEEGYAGTNLMMYQ